MDLLKKYEKVSFCSDFRFIVEAVNYDNEVEEVLGDLCSKIVESGRGLDLYVSIPQDLGELTINSFLTTCGYIKTIKITHKNSFEQEVFSTRYNIEEFSNWEIVSDAESNDILKIKLSFTASPVTPVSQTKEGLAEWLKKRITSSSAI